MIARSVPGYSHVQKLIGGLARDLLTSEARVLDIGCSTGASFLSIHREASEKNLHYIGIDNSQDMLDRCKEVLLETGISSASISLQRQNIEQADFPQNKLTCLNYTLQFVETEQRLQVLARIYEALESEGYLVFSEKVVHEPQWLEELVQAQHLRFKIEKGYSPTEVEKKKAALDNVLVPISAQNNTQMLKEAGFQSISLVEKHFSFCTWLCKKI